MDIHQAFEQIELQLRSSSSVFDIANGPMRVGQRFVDFLKESLKNIDLSGMTKAEFVAKVLGLYDSFVAPMVLQVPAGVLVNALVRGIVSHWAENFYAKHSTPKVA